VSSVGSVVKLYRELYASLLIPSASDGSDRKALLVEMAETFSPRYELHGEHLVTLDLRGLERMFGTPRAIGEAIVREAAARGVSVHVAIAATQVATQLLARSRPGLTVVAGGSEAALLAAAPIGVLEKLAQAAAEPPPLAVLRQWGLRTLGAFAALPGPEVAARLGAAGVRWQAVAQGRDARPLVPMVADERFDGALELEWPIEGIESLAFVLTRLLEPLSTRLERRDRGAAAIDLTLRLTTRDEHRCRLELPTPMRDVRALRTLMLLDLEAHPPAAGIERVSLVIEPTPGRIVQHTLFARPHPTPEQLSTLLARLQALMGQSRVGAPQTVDSYRPGAFTMAPFALERKNDHRRNRQMRRKDFPQEDLSSAASAASAVDVPASESQLLAPGLPPSLHAPSGASARQDQPLVSALRRYRQPVPARVAVDAAGRPLRVTTDRRSLAGGTVQHCAGPWRTSGEWWESGTGRAGEAGWDRDEWDVALGDEGMYRIFHDRVTDAWFIEAVVD